MIRKMLFQYFKKFILEYVKPKTKIYRTLYVKKGKIRGFRTYDENHERIENIPNQEIQRILNQFKNQTHEKR